MAVSRLTIWFVLTAATGAAVLSSAAAAEPVEAFLQALRGKGYHDMAVEYLNRAVKRPDVDEAFKRRFAYETGTLLLDAARTAGEGAARDDLAARGLESLKEFATSNPDHELVVAAKAKIADALLARGRALARRAERGRDQQAVRTQARAMLQEAIQHLEAVEKHQVAQFNEQSPRADAEKRNQLGGPILESRLRIAEGTSDLAKTFPAGSPEAEQALRQGIDRYKQLYDKYHSDGFVAAYVARVREAESYLQLDQPDEALSRLKDVLQFDVRNESLRDLVLTPGYLVALKAWSRKGEHDAALEGAAAYVANPGTTEVNRAEWLEMQFLLATAYLQRAQTLKPGEAQRTKYESEARKLAGQVVKYQSGVQNDARLLLGKLGRPVEAETTAAKTFDEAIEKATVAIQQFSAAKLAADSPDRAEQLDKAERERIHQQMADALTAAFRAVQRSLLLADETSELTKVNTARFFLCYLHWEYAQTPSAPDNIHKSHYFDAAVLGEHLARRYSDHPNARQAMAIALASYQQIRQDASTLAKTTAEKSGLTGDELTIAVDKSISAWSERIAQLAQYAMDKWPNTDEAASAVAVLASLAVERQDFDVALKLVEQLKPGSARHGDTQLRIGRAVWAHYVRSKKILDSAASAASDSSISGGTDKPGLTAAESRKLLSERAKQAQTMLEQGLGAAKKSETIDRTFVLGLWALVQSYVATSQPEKAIPWLEDESLGLLALVNSKHEAAEIEGLMFDAYRLALRAYIAVKPQQLDKALATMDALEKITGSDAKGREMLTSVYIAMGRDLQQEIKQLVAVGDADQVASLSTSFEAFLKRLVGRESGNTFNSLFWVADTFIELGSGLAQSATGSAADPHRSRDYYAQAVTALDKILERDKADSAFMPDKYLPLVQTRLAKAYRGAGQHQQALALLAGLLKDKPNVLEIQFDAAYTFQEMAQSTADGSKYFRRAILGGDEGEERNVWGWNELAQKIRAQESRLRREAADPAKAEQAHQYAQRYQEARYNSAYCTFSLATASTAPVEKQRLLKVAKQGIWSVYAIVDAEFGGGPWKAKNDKLLRDIQRALREPEVGLKEFEQKKQQQAQASKAELD